MIPMLVMTGKVDNVYLAPEGVSKKTGEAYGGGIKVQLRVDQPLPNGETKRALVTLSTLHGDYFRSMLDRSVSLPVGAMAYGKDVLFYVLRGWNPPPIGSPQEADSAVIR